MSNLDTRLKEDRALRDSARRLIGADLGVVKGDVKDRRVGQRAADIVQSGSRAAVDSAMAFAVQRPLVVSSIFIATLGFFFRNAIIDAILNFLGDDDLANGDNNETVTAIDMDGYPMQETSGDNLNRNTNESGGCK